MDKKLYKRLGVNPATAQPGDLMRAAQLHQSPMGKALMKSHAKHKKYKFTSTKYEHQEGKQEDRGASSEHKSTPMCKTHGVAHTKAHHKTHHKGHSVPKHLKKMSLAEDTAYDRKHGIKEGSKEDLRMDRKHGIKDKKHAKHKSHKKAYGVSKGSNPAYFHETDGHMEKKHRKLAHIKPRGARGNA